MRHATISLLVVLAVAVASVEVTAQPARQTAVVPQVIPVRLSNFSYDPDPLRLRVGVPVRLQLVNESSGGHDFVAPAFFAASLFPPGATPPPGGRIEIAGRSTVELTLVPAMAGIFPVKCTHFLHSLFGMTGTIVVTGPGG